MRQVTIVGKVTLKFKQVLNLPDDEAEDLECSCEEDLIINVDLNRCEWEVDEWEDVEVKQ